MLVRFRRKLSSTAGWAADLRIPQFLRNLVYRGFARCAGANLDEARGPLTIYPSLSAFFVRSLVEGARTITDDPAHIACPVDGRVQHIGRVTHGSTLQAKGRSYTVADMLGGTASEVDLEGCAAFTLYLGPRDYHRVHAPEAGRLVSVDYLPGDRFSVNPNVLAKRRVLDINERCVLRFESERGPYVLVMVGALNVGRIRVTGVEPDHGGALAKPREVARGEELARFELGSTVVLFLPFEGLQPSPSLAPGAVVRLGQPLAVVRTN